MTDNHGYDTPEEGTLDWHVPMNANFERLDRDIEIRDQEAQLDSYQPKTGAKFFALDTGSVFIADGNSWLRAPTMQLSVEDSFRLPLKNVDPTNPTDGELWFRADLGELRVATDTGTQTLAFSTSDLSTVDSGSSYDVTEPFDDSSWIDTFGEVWDYGVDTHTSVYDVDGRDGNQLDMLIPAGENRGVYTVHNHETRTGTAPTKLYHSFYLRFEPGFNANLEDDGKLPGFGGRDGTDEGAGGNPANGTGWSARMGWDDPWDYPGDGIPLDWYLYHMDTSGSYGEHNPWGILLEEGRWYRIEQYIDLGTPDTNDGVLRGWVDGSLEFERTDLRFRKSGGNDVQWTWWDFYHGGGNAPSGDIHVQFDDLNITRGGMP